MGTHSVRDRQARIREYMADHGVNYTTAARALDASGLSGPPQEGCGGHAFDYEGETDLFRCWMCRVYEVVARDGDCIAPCTGLVGYGGEIERVYLLVTENPAAGDCTAILAWRIGGTGIGRAPRYSWRESRLLVESAPGVVADLARRIGEMTLAAPRGGTVHAALSIAQLTADEGRTIIADNHAAFVAEFGVLG
jgi:hypothetical protein